MAETRRGIPEYCFRHHPSASEDVRGYPRHFRAEDGRWKIGNYFDKDGNSLNGRNWGGMPKVLLPSDPMDIRGLCGRKMEDGGLLWGWGGADFHKCQKLGRRGRNIASFGFRGSPRYVWTEDGSGGIIRKNLENRRRWQKLVRIGHILSSVSLRLFPRTAVDTAVSAQHP